MIEPSLEVNGNSKPLSQLSKAETEALINKLYEKLDLAVGLNSNAIENQIRNFLTMAQDRLELFEAGVIKVEVKERTARKISILDDDF
jgi:hypothetical protein